MKKTRDLIRGERYHSRTYPKAIKNILTIFEYPIKSSFLRCPWFNDNTTPFLLFKYHSPEVSVQHFISMSDLHKYLENNFKHCQIGHVSGKKERKTNRKRTWNAPRKQITETHFIWNMNIRFCLWMICCLWWRWIYNEDIFIFIQHSVSVYWT